MASCAGHYHLGYMVLLARCPSDTLFFFGEVKTRRAIGKAPLPDVQKSLGSFPQRGPGLTKHQRFVVGLVVKRRGVAVSVDLDELHQAVHPGAILRRRRGAQERNDDLSTRAVYFSPADLDHAPDPDGFVTPQIQHAFQDEVGVQSRGPERGGIGSLEGQ
jgi:hypothetical protein